MGREGVTHLSPHQPPRRPEKTREAPFHYLSRSVSLELVRMSPNTNTYTAQQQATLRQAHDMVTIYYLRRPENLKGLDPNGDVQHIATMLAQLDPQGIYRGGQTVALNNTPEMKRVKLHAQRAGAVRRDLKRMVDNSRSSGGHDVGASDDQGLDLVCIAAVLICLGFVFFILFACIAHHMYLRREAARDRGDYYDGYS
ncbi:uncharacterized protein J3D65DRAFT_620582 [Phyllosticta citribraziliensis]|uniref:Uncharacterized protein n=1 Tax=Phyllosticta citribraziliensis TaxID=989973 RepID=A0ABR1LXX7_9PEZI